MFEFNNTHIFTGYLKQLLSSANIPTCKIYTREFANYLKIHGQEDPRIVESFDAAIHCIDKQKKIYKSNKATRVNYIKNGEIFKYFLEEPLNIKNSSIKWLPASDTFYEPGKKVLGLTRSLNSLNNIYDTTTHEFLGEYLRFIRDYYDINLMSLYNCFNDKLYGNVFCNITTENNKKISMNSLDSRYKIYAFPVKLFAEYTIAVDSNEGIEIFCGFYKNTLDLSSKSMDLIRKTYVKYNKTLFSQPLLFDKLAVKNWNLSTDTENVNGVLKILDNNSITRWDILNREQDLKIFLKVPVSCKSTITVLEGDYRRFNDYLFKVQKTDTGNYIWNYQQNHNILNFEDANLNESAFKPIGKLQLLAVNSGQSYPFSDRLVEYLSKSAITPIDEISDNVKRAQKVMNAHGHYFKVDGIWENKMQKIVYDYLMNSGPFETVKTSNIENSPTEYNVRLNATTNVSLKKKNSKDADRIIIDKRKGLNPRLGHNNKSFLFDVLGYVDKDAEKWYASWMQKEEKNGKVITVVKDSIQNVDIYNGLYDI